jgi:AcrR family transcriptional regulator
MARIVKEQEYAVRRNAILDVAQQLINSKGYEQMAIQDILDDLQISKGAFYHYFDSKQALLEALVDRLGGGVKQLVLPVVYDQSLSALEKFQGFLDSLNRWKVGQKAIFLALLRVWYADENALVRHKLRIAAIREVGPLFNEIVRQGIKEGVMTTIYPDQLGEVVVCLIQDLGETIGTLLFLFDPERDDMQRVERIVAVYTDAIERVLGVPAGSLSLIDTQTLKEWFLAAKDHS